MPRRSSGTSSSQEDEDDSGRSRPRRDTKAVSYSEEKGDDGDDPMEVDAKDGEENPAPATDTEEEEAAEEEEEAAGRRRSARARSNSTTAAAAASKENMGGEQRRTSSRATKFTGGMKEPSETIRDLLKDDTNNNNGGGKASKKDKASKKSSTTTARRRKGSAASTDLSDEDESEDEQPKKQARSSNKRGNQKQLQQKQKKQPAKKKQSEPSSPHKAPARRHRQARLSISHINTTQSDGSDSDDSFLEELREDDSDGSEDDEDEETPFKIQRIVASRTEPRKEWANIGSKMSTSEIDYGSRWVQDVVEDTDDTFEERFLVKWNDMSYMHVSWETESDLNLLVENAKNYLSTFFRKSSHGLLFSSDERCDGDYFDPGWTQIDRILEVHFPEECPCKSVKDEDKVSNEDLGIVLDPKNEAFEEGKGREFLIKWGNSPYAESTFEFERDLVLNEVEYKDQLKGFNRRKKKPTKEQAKNLQKDGEAEFRRLYKSVFGDKSKAKESDGVEKYQQDLEDHVFKNGGQLRDYQAEGVSWLLANFINKRSAILADEMGLGKTIQTASFLNLVATKMNRRGPFLIIAPLSTLAHWQREFEGWTELNTIVYHGSADDRRLIRELEISHESNRPTGGVGFNQLYLRKCRPKKKDATVGNPWMAEVVITTPELLCADDFQELTAVDWECMVVDEAHRLKNHSSKLAVNLRDNKFVFGHKVLLTGTPIQNTMQELHALLSFVDPDLFDDVDDFMEKYGDMKSKERIDELHEEIRPFILRRLKEDVEKSVPPKEETVIEVELTIAQKQYYRALYEKNVKFLHKNKKKALDGPSLNNLAMQLRKCCNHLFLLNGIEEEFRDKQRAEGKSMLEADLLVAASGKLVLLDKLLPRLKENGHRILIFSQFKIMLDVLEDYLQTREVKFERIDGSITGNKRQQAIDRFQTPNTEGKENPFVMLLSTRAGGVGINLTAADTCIIFDSDWNPQNDLQAQARCHRIGQTKSVKVYRLLTAKTYEMQMFHMSSLKMGLDQAVLSGFEAGPSGEGALSKDEVEKLLRHGAYGIFSEDNDGAAESNDFVQQDIDTILERRSRKVVHDNTGSQSNAAGGTFSKARFTAPTAAGEKNAATEEVDVEDPDFWKKMVGEAKDDEGADDLAGQRRKRKVLNYSEGVHENKVDESLLDSDAENDEDESGDESYASDDGTSRERFRWGGGKLNEWKKEDAKKILIWLHAHGYFVKELAAKNAHDENEVQRMCWSTLLLALCEIAEEDAAQTKRRAVRAAEKKRENTDDEPNPSDGGVLAEMQGQGASEKAEPELIQKCFDKLWTTNACWATSVFEDALNFAVSAEPRSEEILSRGLDSAPGSANPLKQDEISALFVSNVWPSLKSRGWKAALLSEGPNAGKTQYSFEGKQYYSPESVLLAVGSIHSELANMVDSMRTAAESSRQKSVESEAKLKEKHLAMKAGTINVSVLQDFLRKYAPLQLLCDRRSHKRLHLSSRKMMHTCTFLYTATSLVRHSESSRGGKSLAEKLSVLISVDKRMTLPHPMWTTRHDAILIHAIAKHGWLENDSSCRGITNDSTIKWGFPFDSAGEERVELAQVGSAVGNESSIKKTSQKDELIKNLKDTAARAAALFNVHNDTLDQVKGFNKNVVIRAYSLVYENHDTSDEEGNADNEVTSERSRWVVDEAQLVASTGLESTSTESLEFVELPTKKDLVKRAKLVLSKNVDVVGSHSQASLPAEAMKVDVEIPDNFFVLDQSDRCNVLLAEILKATVKAPYNAKTQGAIRMLCAIATEEATKRKDSMALFPAAQEKNQARSEMAATINNIDMAKTSLKQPRQAKNILRVILGSEIVKNPRGSNFPVEGTNLPRAGGQRNPLNGATKTKKEDSAVGDRALARAMAKCFERNTGGPGRVLPEGHSSDLELTSIETLIISVCCSQGLPIWNENLSALLCDDDEASDEESNPETSFALGWLGLGGVLAAAAKEWHETAIRKVEACEEVFLRYEDQESESQPKIRARKNLANAIKIEEVKELAASQANDYSEDPAILAKKTVMLVERLRRKMGLSVGGHTKTTKKVNYWLGPKVFDYLSTQLTEWARSLDIVDAKGGTLSYTAADFYHDLPVDERERVEVTTHLNKQDCRQLLIQITLLSRLRSLFIKYPKPELLPRIESAAKNCKVGDSWEAQPPWWTSGGESPSHHDALLLESLVEYGFGGVLTHAKRFSSTGEDDGQSSLKELGMTKANVQQRSNQLVRELHNLERSQFIIREIDERRRKSVDAEAGQNGGKKARKQTALHSFFAKTAPLGKASNVVVLLSDNEDDKTPEIVEIDMSPQKKEPDGAKFGENIVTSGSKRLETATSSEDSSSPEKKKARSGGLKSSSDEDS